MRKVRDPRGNYWGLYIVRSPPVGWKEGGYTNVEADFGTDIGERGGLVDIPIMLVTLIWSSILSPILRFVALKPFTVAGRAADESSVDPGRDALRPATNRYPNLDDDGRSGEERPRRNRHLTRSRQDRAAGRCGLLRARRRLSRPTPSPAAISPSEPGATGRTGGVVFLGGFDNAVSVRRPSWFEPVDTVGEWVGLLGGLLIVGAVVAVLLLEPSA